MNEQGYVDEAKSKGPVVVTPGSLLCGPTIAESDIGATVWTASTLSNFGAGDGSIPVPSSVAKMIIVELWGL